MMERGQRRDSTRLYSTACVRLASEQADVKQGNGRYNNDAEEETAKNM